MSDFEHSSVTYTSVPSPVEDYSDIGSPEVDGPPSLDYVPGPEEPEQAPPSPVYLPYVPKPVYPEYMPPEDDVFPTEEQPLPIAATPTADSPGYIPEFDPNGDSEEDDKEDPEEDPVDYPADSTVVALPAVDHFPSKERLRFASLTPSQEVRESSAAGAATQNEPAIARDDPYSLVREELYGFVDRKMAPKRTTRSTPVITTPVLKITTSVTNAQLQAMSDQGVTAVLAARDTNRNGDDNHTSRMAYSQRFQELALMCDQMFPKEIDKVDRYVDGLPDTIHGSVMATKPKTMQDAIEFATELMNKKINTWAERQADNKIKSDDTTRNNHQQPR
nr:hypothetical protein [Tanacetum cinerariifolium]